MTTTKTIKPGTRVERSVTIERASVNEDARTVELAFSSEQPYERYWGVEILDHAAASVRLGRLMAGGPLLCDHNTRDQIGVIESVQIDADRVGRAVVRFGKGARASEVYQDVIDGIRRNVSVGYVIHKAVLVEMDEESDTGTYRVTDWEPFEISLVSVPADTSVGVGRSDTTIEFVTDDVAVATEPAPVIQTSTRSISMSDTTTQPPVDVTKIAADASKAAQERASTIISIGEQFAHVAGVQKAASEAVRAGTPVEEFRSKVMELLASKNPTPDLGLTRQEAQRYSVLRAIRAMTDRDWSKAGFELECSRAIAERAGLNEAPNGGFFVPYEVQKRDLTAASPSGGGYLVATENLGGSFIDLLRNRTLVAQLGATMLTGLQGNVTVPKQIGANTAYWLTNEATQITEGNATFGQLALTPKHIGAYQEISRQLMMQSSPAADGLVMNDLAKVLAIGIDLAAFEGTGASGQPTGIANTAGIGSVTGTSLAYSGVIEFQTDVAGSNALAANCAYVTTPTVAGFLAGRNRFANTDTPLWQGNILDGTMAGFRAASTLQLTAASMIFGDFSQVVIGEWGLLEIALNPYANFQAAITGIRAIQCVDVGVRYAGAFSRATSIT